MNSTAENGSEISKLAHQPANIIGGRRVQNSGNHNHRHENLQDALREVLDSGLLAKMDRAYPTESVKRTHEKIQPATQLPFVNRGTSGGAQRFIPRKQNN